VYDDFLNELGNHRRGQLGEVLITAGQFEELSRPVRAVIEPVNLGLSLRDGLLYD
jgi:hypothetical protein